VNARLAAVLEAPVEPVEEAFELPSVLEREKLAVEELLPTRGVAVDPPQAHAAAIAMAAPRRPSEFHPDPMPPRGSNAHAPRHAGIFAE
jgi:hypothetical protein